MVLSYEMTTGRVKISALETLFVETNSLRFLVAERDQQAVDGLQVDFTHNWLLGDGFGIRPPPSHLPEKLIAEQRLLDVLI